jgi:putative hydrolase of the HAD superfamily
MIRAVAFDLFGTLIGFRGAGGDDTGRRALATVGLRDLHKARITLQTRCFASTEDALAAACAAEGVRALPTALAEGAAIYRESLSRTVVDPEALPAIQALRKDGLKIALISNLMDIYRRPFLDSPLAPHFDAVVFSCDAGLRKPQREIYDLAASRLGIPEEEVAMVGDQAGNDVAGPLEAGYGRAFHLDAAGTSTVPLPPRASRIRSLAEVPLNLDAERKVEEIQRRAQELQDTANAEAAAATARMNAELARAKAEADKVRADVRKREEAEFAKLRARGIADAEGFYRRAQARGRELAEAERPRIEAEVLRAYAEQEKAGARDARIPMLEADVDVRVAVRAAEITRQILATGY